MLRRDRLQRSAISDKRPLALDRQGRIEVNTLFAGSLRGLRAAAGAWCLVCLAGNVKRLHTLTLR